MYSLINSPNCLDFNSFVSLFNIGVRQVFGVLILVRVSFLKDSKVPQHGVGDATQLGVDRIKASLIVYM